MSTLTRSLLCAILLSTWAASDRAYAQTSHHWSDNNQSAASPPTDTQLSTTSVFSGAQEAAEAIVPNSEAEADGDPRPDPDLPVADLFQEPGNAPFFIRNNQLIVGIRDAVLKEQPPAELLEAIKEAYAADVSFNAQSDYGGEALYEAVGENGQPLLYISLVRLKQADTLLVIWYANPHTIESLPDESE